MTGAVMTGAAMAWALCAATDAGPGADVRVGATGAGAGVAGAGSIVAAGATATGGVFATSDSATGSVTSDRCGAASGAAEGCGSLTITGADAVAADHAIAPEASV